MDKIENFNLGKSVKKKKEKKIRENNWKITKMVKPTITVPVLLKSEDYINAQIVNRILYANTWTDKNMIDIKLPLQTR